MQGIIVSHPDNGVGGYGLTGEGRQQVEASVAASGLGKDTVIYSSDFRRTRESAEIAQKLLGAEPIHLTKSLRERSFGQLEKLPDANYQKVWDQDAADPHGNHHGVESVADVMDRATQLVAQLEGEYQDKTLLLVSHGDVIMTLLGAFASQPASEYRSAGYPEQGEVRELKPNL